MTDIGIPIVVHPAADFDRIATTFETSGWTGGPTVRTAPLLAGEPELAVWRLGTGVARYEFDPTCFLRVVRVEGPAPCPPLPQLDDETIVALLAARADEHRLLAVRALGALDRRDQFAAISGLGHDPSPFVANAARALAARWR